MGRAFARITFTPSVKAAQSRYGTRETNRALETTRDSQDELTDFEREFIGQRDGFYMATVSESGWPYVQFRGGPAGFLKVIDAKTIAFADFRGNVQYLSVGNLRADGRVALILMDHAHRARLKLWGEARVADQAAEPELVASLVVPGYKARVERAIVIRIAAFDWNCPQHITPRFTEAEIQAHIAPMLAELESLRAASRGAANPATPTSIGNGELALVVTGARRLTSRVRAYELRARDGQPLPPVEAGAHVPVPVVDAQGIATTRHYSIASDPDDPTRWEIAVLREDAGGGGSAFIHARFGLDVALRCGLPANGFRLHDDRRPAVLIAGGIGVTPIKAMAHVLQREGRDFELHFAARSSSEAPYLPELQREFAQQLRTHWSEGDARNRLDIDAVVRHAPPDAVFYVCGPARMLARMCEVSEASALPAGRVRFERFAAPVAHPGDRSFEVVLRRSGAVYAVPSGKSVLDVLLEAGEHPSYDCRTGTCGTCATRVLEGQPDHRDLVLTKAEHDRERLMCTCVSRSLGERLVLDL